MREWRRLGKSITRKSYVKSSRFNYFFAAAYKSILSDAFFMYTSGTCNGGKMSEWRMSWTRCTSIKHKFAFIYVCLQFAMLEATFFCCTKAVFMPSSFRKRELFFREMQFSPTGSEAEKPQKENEADRLFFGRPSRNLNQVDFQCVLFIACFQCSFSDC